MGGVILTLMEMFQGGLERQQNHLFLEGVMVACAMVATTDGKVSFAENVRVHQILQTLDRLKVFDPQKGVDISRAFRESIFENPETCHAEAR